jgi:dynein heavy chain
MLIGVGGSGK